MSLLCSEASTNFPSCSEQKLMDVLPSSWPIWPLTPLIVVPYLFPQLTILRHTDLAVPQIYQACCFFSGFARVSSSSWKFLLQISEWPVPQFTCCSGVTLQERSSLKTLCFQSRLPPVPFILPFTIVRALNLTWFILYLFFSFLS